MREAPRALPLDTAAHRTALASLPQDQREGEMDKHIGARPRPGHLRIAVDADIAERTAVILSEGRVIPSRERLLRIRGFLHLEGGAWISAAQATSGLWGYIDQDGQWRVAPTLQDACNPLQGETVARFCDNGQWGFIDLQTGRSTPPLFADATALRGGASGVAGVQVGHDAWRIADASGAFTSDAVLQRVHPFGKCGLARALRIDPHTQRPLYGYVDRKGAWVIPPQFQDAHDFEDHEVAGATHNGALWGLINTRGSWLLPPRHARIGAFNDHHLAYFAKPNAWNEGVGYLDTHGHAVFESDRGLSDTMVCGIARHHALGSRYLCHDGSALPAPPLRYGSHFHAGGGFAVVLACADAGQPARWGLLHANGRFVPAPAQLLEPLVQGHGELALPEDGTPLVPFVTDSGGVAWMDGEGHIPWHARYHATCVALENAGGQTLWEGRRLGAECRAPRLFFQPPPERFLQHIASPEQVVDCAQSLLRAAQVLLHRFAAGEDPCAAGEDEGEVADEGDTPGPSATPGHPRRLDHAARATMLRRRLLRTHLDEAGHDSFELLSEWRTEAACQMLQALQGPLESCFGPPTPDPEHAVALHAEGAVTAWPARMTRALPGDGGTLQEASTLWLTLYRSFGADDGDVWNEIWLMVAPSIDALQTAVRMREHRPVRPVVYSAPAQERRMAYADTLPALPRTREEWLTAVEQDVYALAQVPAQWMDDAMADAAVLAHPQAFEDLPERLQTPQRLDRVIRSGPAQALRLAPRCMTPQGLTLARALHTGHEGWDARDRAASPLPTTWHRHALQGVWGALITPALALAAVENGVPLCDVPSWLRTEALEQAALNADICNIAHIAKDRITPALAARAVRHQHGRLIALLPRALLTADLCLASVTAYGATLEDVPLALRTEAVCVAALQERWDAFAHVPRPLRVAVTTRLIEHDLAEHEGPQNPAACAVWLCQRAWAYLDHGDYEKALDEAAQAAPHTSQAEHMHYVQARALRALGRLPEAAVQASAVLSRAASYRPDWDYDEDTRWLTQLARRAENTAAAAVDDDALLAALQARPRMLADVPRERITEALVQVALAADAGTVRHVPHRLMTSQRYALALRAGVKSLEQVPPALLSEDIYLEYVRGSGWRLSKVPQEWRTVGVCALAVADTESALKHVPRALRDAVMREVRALTASSAPSTQSRGRREARRSAAGKGVESQRATNRRGKVLAFLRRSSVSSTESGTPQRDRAARPLRGPLAWLDERPELVSAVHTLWTVVAVGAHLALTVNAWRLAGAWIGLGTLVLPGLSQLYWAPRFLWGEPASLSLGLSALTVPLYLFGWRWAHRRLTQDG
ncbi:MAG: WG repeat-containing protein [Comamonadaceae bacterium]|nr:MAG: WG repeat-containing protein [Comamonadaceae bacterium]